VQAGESVAAKILEASRLVTLKYSGSLSATIHNKDDCRFLLGRIESEPSIELTHLILPYLSIVEVVDVFSRLHLMTNLSA
jgi:hypothetical protein